MGNNVEVSVIPFHVFSAVIPGNYSLGLFPMLGKVSIIIIIITITQRLRYAYCAYLRPCVRLMADPEMRVLSLKLLILNNPWSA